MTHTFTVSDAAGNTASVTSAAVSVDLTPPTLRASIRPMATPSGWYDVTTGAPTVSFSSSDSLSGRAGANPSPVTLGNGANQSVSATVWDVAGNST